MMGDERDELKLFIWRGLDEQVRSELLHAVAFGAPRDPGKEALYPLAEHMLRLAMEQELLRDACAEVIGAEPESWKD